MEPRPQTPLQSTYTERHQHHHLVALLGLFMIIYIFTYDIWGTYNLRATYDLNVSYDFRVTYDLWVTLGH